MRLTSFKITAPLGLLLLAAADASAASGDLLSVNYTVFIEVVIFVAAIIILNALVFQPFLKLMDRRDRLTKGTMEEAKDLEARVKSIIEEYEARLADARAHAQEERTRIVREAQDAATGIVSKAREETSSLIEDAKKKLEAESEAIKQKLSGDVELLAKDISSKILGREAGA
ncbi:MAG: ATP synthase F0 subunit B [Candidatus Dadabacteria bacterium]|jgi:F-type H+-transporting ATPase subunit b|nr:ATP synthase F0 subunit B [Candidatus Dadabacteria bacterium]